MNTQLDWGQQQVEQMHVKASHPNRKVLLVVFLWQEEAAVSRSEKGSKGMKGASTWIPDFNKLPQFSPSFLRVS